SASRLLAEAEEARALLQQRHNMAAAECDELRDPTELKKRLRTRAEEMSKQSDAYDAALREEGGLTSKIGDLESELDKARIEAAGYDLERDGTLKTAKQNIEDLTGQQATTKLRVANAEKEVREHEEAVRQAREGQFGIAGEIIRTLDAAPESVSAI